MFGQPIQKTFGPALVELRRKYLPVEQVRALERLLEQTGTSVGSLSENISS